MAAIHLPIFTNQSMINEYVINSHAVMAGLNWNVAGEISAVTIPLTDRVHVSSVTRSYVPEVRENVSIEVEDPESELPTQLE